MSNYPEDFKGTNMDGPDDYEVDAGDVFNIAAGKAKLAGKSDAEIYGAGKEALDKYSKDYKSRSAEWKSGFLTCGDFLRSIPAIPEDVKTSIMFAMADIIAQSKVFHPQPVYTPHNPGTLISQGMDV